jgi:hypothetical protein
VEAAPPRTPRVNPGAVRRAIGGPSDVPLTRACLLNFVRDFGECRRDRKDDGQDGRTWALLAMTAVAAASGWRRALLLWPVTAIWSSIVFVVNGAETDEDSTTPTMPWSAASVARVRLAGAA